MHTKIIRRIFESILMLGIICIPVTYSLSQASLISLTEGIERQGKVDAIYDALDNSADAHNSIPSAHALRTQGEEGVQRAEEVLLRRGKQKREVRLRLARRFAAREAFQEKYGIDPSNQEAVADFLEKQRPGIRAILRKYARLQYLNRSHTGAFGMLSTTITASLADHVGDQSRFRALRTFRMKVFSDASAMQSFSRELVALQEEHEGLLEEYHSALDDLDTAEAKIALSDARLAEIKRIVAKVEQKIRQMQVELAAYDERIRLRAENDLLEKGLLNGPARRASIFSFLWPAIGRVTAGFYDASYMEYFGVPHKAIDIAQSQGSAVRSASDGIVYYVQHGGARGYSYVLVGHQRGYATLYGHLSAIHVSTGQDIYAGQIIGLSGGRPGTVGAGPMTTGAHLHFEVIHNGAHVDPLTVLP